MVYDDDPPGPLGAIEDERLRLIFTCCHPAPPRPAGVAPANPDRTPCKSGCRPRWNTRRGPEAGEHRGSGPGTRTGIRSRSGSQRRHPSPAPGGPFANGPPGGHATTPCSVGPT
jgi:hypothetical protein